MRTVKYMDEEKAIKKAMQSVKRHREWQKMLSKDIFFDEVFADKST
jgi:hypothetical protein